jgi:nucleotide-binding universal stress UspA family protein
VAHSQETGEHYIAAKKLLKEAAERVNDCVTSSAVDISTMIIEDNSPARGIVEHSDATGDCRLIVLGNRGHSGLASVVLGSVSSHVLHEAHCPVVIVRE